MFDGLATGRDEDAGSRRWILALVVLTGVGLLAAIPLIFGPKTVPWKVTGRQLQIHAPLQWSDDYAVCDLDSAHAEAIDLTRDPGWRPAKKVWGLDGSYTAGDYYVRNGKEAEVYLVQETQAVLLARSGAIPVLIGATDPAALISALRAACP